MLTALLQDEFFENVREGNDADDTVFVIDDDEAVHLGPDDFVHHGNERIVEIAF